MDSAPIRAMWACLGGCLALSALAMASPQKEYYWPRRAGDASASSSSPHVAPSDFSAGPSWVWPNDLDEQVRHSPLIDDELNIYIMTSGQVRKFTPDGSLLWTWRIWSHEEGKMSSSCALYNGALYAFATRLAAGFIHVYSVDMASGAENWKHKHLVASWEDAVSIFPYNDTLIIPARDHRETKPTEGNDDGNNMVFAVSTADGSHLWQYVTDGILWNFAPATPGDGTLIFSSQCGGVYRITFGGELVWRSGRPPNPEKPTCGCGGGTLGPNGLFYAEFNDPDSAGPLGVVSAHRVSDGALVWERQYSSSLAGWQYPAVGRLEAGGPITVVAALGEITGRPPILTLPVWFPMFFKKQWWRLYLYSHFFRRITFFMVGKKEGLASAVVAIDAETGAERWRFEEEPWFYAGGAGDDDGFVPRYLRFGKTPFDDVICLPDNHAIPLIAGDGVVYSASSHNGDLRAIKDRDGNGIIDPSEVSLFKTHQTFLNSPSIAPGLLVAAPCWGPVYVFRGPGR